MYIDKYRYELYEQWCTYLLSIVCTISATQNLDASALLFAHLPNGLFFSYLATFL